MHGLNICPDLDTVVYTLARLANPTHGWGIRGDTFECLRGLAKLGAETWFQLGDRDLATHIFLTHRLRSGAKLSAVTSEICNRLGLRCTICPMSDDRVRTIVRTPDGKLPFQTYFVQRHAQDRVLSVAFDGAARARPAPGLLKAIREASGIIFCPSNPIISVGPILAVPGVRRALERRRCPAVAISPIVGGRALKGPAAEMMASMGMEASALGVAKIYKDLVDVLVVDREDEHLVPAIENLGIETRVTNTIMSGIAEKKALARVAVRALEKHKSVQ
jgi:LPPG:FO 2-phospho-L-lactate transferase